MTPAPTPPNDIAASVGPFPDLDILAIEVTQGIQDLNNNMPLVAGRRTFARVYLDVIGADELAHTYGALEARRGGQQVGWIWPENGPITATANGGNRLELDDSLYFRLPQSWLDGTVKVTAFVYSHQVDFPWSKEASWQNNFEEETVTFHEAEPLDLHLVTLHLHRSFHPTDVVREYEASIGGALDLATSSTNDTARILAGLRRYHPISEITFDVFPVPIQPLDHIHDDEWDLGDCSVPLVDGVGTVTLADWHPLMDDPAAEVTTDASTEPDNATIWVMDRTIEVSHFYPRADGTASVFGSMTGTGPAPFPGAPAFVDSCENPNDESGEPNSTVALWRAWYDWAETREFFVGMVDESLPTRWGGLASSLDTAWVKMRTAVNPEWYLGGAATMAHEVAHLTGLDHVPCSNNNDDDVPDELAGGPIDETHPQMDRFPKCSLAEIREHGYYGFDVYHDLFGLSEPIVISNNPAAPTDNVAYPMLSYKTPRWTDPYHYCLMLVYYGVPCDPDGLDEPFDPPTDADSFWFPGGHGDPPPDPGLPILLVSGSIDHDASSASLRGQMTIDDPTTAVLEHLERQAVVHDEEIVARLIVSDVAGKILFEAPIADRSSVHEPTDPFAFDMLVPLDPDGVLVEVVDPAGRTIETLELTHKGFLSEWSEVGRGTGAIAIDELSGRCCSVVVPDADGRNLTATLLYSPDGEHWQVLGAAAGTEVSLDDDVIPTLPGSEDGRLRIIVSDGIETVVADGEPTVRVPNGAPLAWIDAPAKPMSFPLGGRITLSGAAQDREDRQVPDSALAWSSSIDGPLGMGPELMTRGLSAGRHTIVLEATDSAGITGQASIELVVDGSVVDTGVPVELETAVAGILERLGDGLDPSPVAALGPAPSDGIPTPVLFVVVMALLAIGGTSVWIRVAQPHTTSGGEIAMKGASISENAPATEPNAPRATGSVEGLNMEADVIEAPPDDLPLDQR